jgi:hypothetical protein
METFEEWGQTRCGEPDKKFADRCKKIVLKAADEIRNAEDDPVKALCEAYREYVEECPEGEFCDLYEHPIMEAAVEKWLGPGFWKKVNARMDEE